MTQSYQVFRGILPKEDYFDRWKPETLEELDEQLKEYIYNKYSFKCRVLQRDNFECQNEDCTTPNSPLTVHHIKWQKNGGEHKTRNGLTICKACHNGYNKGRVAIRLKDRPELPSHIRGHTLKINPITSINWKKIRKEMAKVRKENKESHGRNIHLTVREIILLMRWLHIPYYEVAYAKFDDGVESVFDVEIDNIVA